MKQHKIVIHENKTHEFTIEAESIEEATKLALAMMNGNKDCTYRIDTYVDGGDMW